MLRKISKECTLIKSLDDTGSFSWNYTCFRSFDRSLNTVILIYLRISHGILTSVDVRGCNIPSY